jgi:hypothetical protein
VPGLDDARTAAVLTWPERGGVAGMRDRAISTIGTRLSMLDFWM